MRFKVICASKVLFCCGLANDESLSQPKQGVDLCNIRSRVSEHKNFFFCVNNMKYKKTIDNNDGSFRKNISVRLTYESIKMH